MREINNIHWHDCVIDSVLELPEKDQLIFNVQYPVDWEQNIFEARSIVFEDYISQEINEIPFSGAPTILNAEVVGELSPLSFYHKYFRVKIETNAGNRFVHAKSVKLVDAIVSI